MDLGIQGRRALICASSKGLGKGCAEALAGEGVDLILNARGAESLEATAANIRSTYGVSVVAVAADITTEAGQAAVLEAAGDIDILVTNAGGPPPGMWSDWGRDDFIAAFDANLLTPIALIKASLPGMMDRGWGRIVNVTSVAVKAPIPVLGLSNTARSGLTGYVAGVSRQVAGSGVTINNLLPGLHDTDRLVTLDKLDAGARGISEDDARYARMQSVPAGRFGTSEEFGAACAWLCSAKAGFVIGQNILLDGGAFPGAL
jgi:3-oxoacyl-[acyl-carrier protein] reductase